MVKMERIEISGYKSIQTVDLSLRPVNILIGANGSGKTNFLSFFEFLHNVYAQNLRGYVANRGIEKMLFNGPKTTAGISARLTFDNDFYSFDIKNEEAGFVFANEVLGNIGDGPTPRTADISTRSYESNLRHSTMPCARDIMECLDGLVKYHFHDTSKNSPFTHTSNVETDKFFLYSRGQNLGAYLYNIRETNPVTYSLIVHTVQSVAPYFGDFFLRPTDNGSIRLLWTSRYSETVYGPTDLSDGSIRFIALATLFLQPSPPATIIIDEPELGLHPAAVTKLAGMIRAAANKGCQIVVATQSTDLLAHFQPEDIITVDLVDGASRFSKLDTQSLHLWMENYYSVDDLWKRNILTQGQPKFL